MFGLLGPNGAGKTTTVEALLGLIPADAGSLSICGFDAAAQPRQSRKVVGAALQSTGLQDDITPREALHAFAALYTAHPDIDGLLMRFGLTEKADQRTVTLSGGQRQRLALALAFVNDPPVIVLDEPTVGLDPQMRRELHDLILAMKAEGRAVLLTTHDMDEAARLCDRIAVLARGRIIAQGRPDDLIAGARPVTRVTAGVSGPVRKAWLAPAALFGDLVCEPQLISFVTADLRAALAALTAALQDHAIQLTGLQAGQGSLEDFILGLVAAAADEAGR